MKNSILLLGACFMLQCAHSNRDWKSVLTINLEGISPIGLTQVEDHIWISDGDNNRLVKMDTMGQVLEMKPDFDRPMHISSEMNTIYIPEYGKDHISILDRDTIQILELPFELDAPAGVDVSREDIAIADFYNHRILFKSKDAEWITIGKKGKAGGEFHYPTDVQIFNDRIYVADAYNHRIQVFDRLGTLLSIFGESQEMNAATGIYVSENQIFITDFENDQVHIYSIEGQYLQTLSEGLEKPTDILQVGNDIWIANYKGHNIKVFSL